MTDNVPCALCNERVQLDESHVRLNAEFRAVERPGEQYVAHVGCVNSLNDPEP